MGRLKPIGSEKLQGDDKIKRIMEIAQYGEVQKNKEYHTQTTSFTKKGADGNVYAIVQEFDGYYLKSGLNESTLDYVSGPMNKKKDRFRSYGSALKRMNLIFKPLNEEHNGGEGISMYEQYKTVVSNEQFASKEALKNVTGEEEMEEQEKFVLKVPEDETDVDMDVDMDLDMGDEEGEEEMDLDMDLDMGDEEEDLDVMGTEGDEEEMEGFMKPIQKLTGKLGQKLRDVAEELGSADIKYVLNSIISAVELDNLDEEDREDVLNRFEEDETSYGDEEEMDVDVDLDFDEEGGEEMEMGDDDFEMEDEDTMAMESLKNRVGALLESYVEDKKPKTDPKTYITERINKVNKIKHILNKCSSVEQEMSVKKFIKENKGFNLNGKTKRGSLVFVSNNEKVLISKNGKIK